MDNKPPPGEQALTARLLPAGNTPSNIAEMIFARHLCGAHWTLLGGLLLPFGDWKVKLAAFSINLLAMTVMCSINHLHNIRVK